MAKLRWDQVNERFYEAGVDRGVLYLADRSGVPWNGLTTLEEDFEHDITNPAYFDGLKYSDIQSTGDFAAKLSAFTYPDEFLAYEGITELGNGLFVDGQGFKTFSLAYRTLIGNVLEGTNYGYKLHLVYNLTAIPDTINYTSLSDSVEPIQFTWSITGIPEQVPNYRPTAHVIFDSRILNADLLKAIEDILYGTDEGDPGVSVIDGGTADTSGLELLDGGTADTSAPGVVDGTLTEQQGVSVDARLPSLEELVAFVFFWNPMYIVPDSVTGLSQLFAGSGDLTMTNVDGIFSALPTTRLVQSNVEGFYELVI